MPLSPDLESTVRWGSLPPSHIQNNAIFGGGSYDKEYSVITEHQLFGNVPKAIDTVDHKVINSYGLNLLQD